ncbi:site-specific DNA-methyltransferase [Candidatus Poribacteria bacterium]|nr:site-specific DNA-methyltransferase [Candidatus Poribacteria bacterium]
MATEPLPRLDSDTEIRKNLLTYCRLKPGDVWADPLRGHRVGVLDATCPKAIAKIMGGKKAKVAVNDPPYNVSVGNKTTQNLNKLNLVEYMEFSRHWVENTIEILDENSHFYAWLGADQKDHFQPLPDFMIMMREFEGLQARSFITMRNQRGYGTQKNWMAVRQELLYYTKGNPDFAVVYTDIPKTLRGYYKTIDGKRVENLERGRSDTLRPGNVWVDIQQVFYRMEENVPGAYAQKPLKAVERIVAACSGEGDLVVDLFAHSGTTLIACERLGRICYTSDIDPIFAEITIRRLEHFRETQKTGFQLQNPFRELETSRVNTGKM